MRFARQGGVREWRGGIGEKILIADQGVKISFEFDERGCSKKKKKGRNVQKIEH
jgi:hypothetical protein